jgi:cytochrome oxidase Cu insertion factor (SCO1/SenC/PrrC family)
MTRAELVALVLGLAALVGVGAGATVALVPSHASSPALPRLHGQAVWSPGERPAPPFTLRDQDGGLVSSSGPGRRPVLLTFLDSRCHYQCPIQGRQLGSMLRRMPRALRPRLLIVSVNPRGDTRASIRHAMTEWGLAGPWEWHWLRGTRPELARVWRGYGITVEPRTNDIAHSMALYLIDGRGFERAGYLFPFLPPFVALDLRTLAEERA